MAAEAIARASQIVERLQGGERRHAFELDVQRFVTVLGTVPDAAPDEWSRESLDTLRALAEAVVEAIEGRVGAGIDSSSEQQTFVEGIYDIRRVLEQIDLWQRHYLG